MAKKAASRSVQTASGAYEHVDSLFQTIVGDVADKLSQDDDSLNISTGDATTVLPLPSLAARFVFQADGMPLGKFFQIVGIEASYKSTFLVEMMRWHNLCGGFAARMEAEDKDNPELVHAFSGYEPTWLKTEGCNSSDDWQEFVTFYTEKYIKNCSLAKGPGKVVPFCMGVDSLCGRATRASIKSVLEAGSAGKAFPDLAGSITRYIQVITSRFRGWPITLAGVNHLRENLADDDKDDKIPGGTNLKYQSSSIIQMTKRGKQETAANTLITVEMLSRKNSYGKERQKLYVPIRLWRQEDQEGVWRLHGRFEWWAASIMLLLGEGQNPAWTERMGPRIDNVVDIRSKSGGIYGKLFWSKTLGVSQDDAMPIHDLGMLLESNVPVVEALYDALEMERRPIFAPAAAAMASRAGYEYIKPQFEANTAMIAKRKKTGAAVSVAPIKRRPKDSDE